MKKYQVAIIGTNIGAKHYEDFQKVKERFNVHTLCGLTREAIDNILSNDTETNVSLNFDEVLKIKGFDTSLGIPHFAGIPLNQIPGDPDSVKGNNVRGIYWTKPDSTGVEVQRESKIDEHKYTEFVDDFKNTYFKEVYDQLTKKYKLGRMRLLLKEPRSTLSSIIKTFESKIFFCPNGPMFFKIICLENLSISFLLKFLLIFQ